MNDSLSCFYRRCRRPAVYSIAVQGMDGPHVTCSDHVGRYLDDYQRFVPAAGAATVTLASTEEDRGLTEGDLVIVAKGAKYRTGRGFEEAPTRYSHREIYAHMVPQRPDKDGDVCVYYADERGQRVSDPVCDWVSPQYLTKEDA